MAEPTPLLTVIIPAHDEAANLPLLIAELDEVLPTISGACEVIVVDDGSRDGSWEEIRRLAESRPWLKGIRFLGCQGQTAAMAAGIEASRGRLVAFLDADLQNDPRDLPGMIAPILAGEVDGVCGWRAHRQDPWPRVLSSKLANRLISKQLGLSLHDLGCTLKVFRRPYIEHLQLFGEMHRFIPAFARAQGARLREVEVHHRPRQAGASHYGFSRTYKVLIDLLTAHMLNTYGSKPAYFFGKLALGFFSLGSLAFAVVAYRALWLDRPQSTPLIFIMMLLFIAALICIMSGLLAEINVRILHQVGGKRDFHVTDRLGLDDPT